MKSNTKESRSRSKTDDINIPTGLNLNSLSADTDKDKRAIENVIKLEAARRRLAARVKTAIVKLEPIICWRDMPAIFPRTINFIQGASGTHKSRLAELICAVLISLDLRLTNVLDFKRIGQDPLTICYIDTERNLNDQFPLAIQSILARAGYSIMQDVKQLYYTSMIEINRSDRQLALEKYVEVLRDGINGHMVIVLDVISDFIADFNGVEESLGIVDWMNSLINSQNITFFCIIHENPGGNKARGHLGTELHNKASTMIQIMQFEKDGQDAYEVKFGKTRNTRRNSSFCVIYSEDINGLRMLTDEEVGDLEAARRKAKKAPLKDLIEFISPKLISGSISQQVLFSQIMEHFGVSDKTVKERLDEIISKQEIFFDGIEEYVLERNKISKEVMYRLVIRKV